MTVVPSTILNVLASHWRKRSEAGTSLSAAEFSRQLSAVALLPDAPRDMQTLHIAMEIFGRQASEILRELHEAQR